VADQKIKDMVIAAAIEAEATPASPLFEFRSHGLQLLLRWSTISNEAAFGTAYFILMAMAKSPLAARAAFTDGSWTPRRRCSAPSEGVPTPMSANGAERKCLARRASGSYPRHCGKLMFVASFSQADQSRPPRIES
jgi:hypothetical protein